MIVRKLSPKEEVWVKPVLSPAIMILFTELLAIFSKL
tara:strand:- start:212 stop:322 length:111 start_codon:yes stop_codon:yes gene_type:complete